MTNLTQNMAIVILSSRNMLRAIIDWTLRDTDSILHTDLHSFLADKLKIFMHQELEKHYHQVELVYDYLKNENISLSTIKKKQGLFNAALKTLAYGLLEEDHGRLAMRWESLTETQHILRSVEISQLTAFTLVYRSFEKPGCSCKISEKELRMWSRDSLIPPVACEVITRLGQKGLAEVHRHMNVSLQPIALWSELMCNDRLPDKLQPEMITWIRGAQHLRAVLFRFLNQCNHDKFIINQIKREFIKVIQLMEYKVNTSRHHTPRKEKWKGYYPNSVPFERRFLHDLFFWMNRVQSDWLTAAVHTYCLIQNLVRAELIMSLSGGKGLDRFVDLFSGHPIRDLVDKEAPSRLVQAYRTGKVFWLEARLPPNKPAERIKNLYDSLRIRKNKSSSYFASFVNNNRPNFYNSMHPSHKDSLPAVGIVFHFVKKECKYDQNTWEKLIIHERNDQERYQGWQQANAIAEILQTDSSFANIILGFDVAGSETRSSMDIYAPHVRYLNHLGRSIDGSSMLSHFNPDDWYRKRITRVTCHAGEDFDHLITGLRHIDEALDFFDLQKGDRIGHGMALGIEPGLWGKRVGYNRILRLGEWLDDLVWFHQWLANCGKHESIRHQVASEISKRVRKIYPVIENSNYSLVETLWEAWQIRKENPPESWFFSGENRPGRNYLAIGGQRYAQDSLIRHLSNNNPLAIKLWKAYHTNPDTRKNWFETIKVELNPCWDTAIKTVQDELTQKLVRKHIVIEINPSSNLTLGPIDDMKEHPVFHWMDPRTDYMSKNSPVVVVGTDDPAAFSTELIYEYALIGRAAEELGATQRQVSAWLEYLRESGVQYSFFPSESFMT